MEEEKNQLIKSNKDIDFTPTTESTFNLLRWKYGAYAARISNIFQLLKDAFGIEEYEMLDPRVINNGVLDSYLMDRQVDWMSGKEINFNEIYNKILEVGEFSKTERDLFESGKIEERLWAIYLLVCNPGIDNLNKLKTINGNDRS